jgi:toxin YoeB
MDLLWDKTAWEDYLYWTECDPNILRKINSLIKECQRTPFAGSGKPEPLKQNLRGFWSRGITGEHRLVYRIDDDVVYIAQCRYHY